MKKRYILASGSPRRLELMRMIVPDIEVIASREVDESYPADMEAADVPVSLSQKKAEAYADLAAEGAVVITADTVVVAGDRILGKPADAAEARAMLRLLSGNTHRVVTGVTVADSTDSKSLAAITEVTFAPLSDAEIDYYIDNYRPFDKAGAYGIQEWIGAVGISHIDGSFYNVMGLPVHRLYDLLKSMGYSLLAK